MNNRLVRNYALIWSLFAACFFSHKTQAMMPQEELIGVPPRVPMLQEELIGVPCGGKHPLSSEAMMPQQELGPERRILDTKRAKIHLSHENAAKKNSRTVTSHGLEYAKDHCMGLPLGAFRDLSYAPWTECPKCIQKVQDAEKEVRTMAEAFAEQLLNSQKALLSTIERQKQEIVLLKAARNPHEGNAQNLLAANEELESTNSFLKNENMDLSQRIQKLESEVKNLTTENKTLYNLTAAGTEEPQRGFNNPFERREEPQRVFTNPYEAYANPPYKAYNNTFERREEPQNVFNKIEESGHQRREEQNNLYAKTPAKTDKTTNKSFCNGCGAPKGSGAFCLNCGHYIK